MDERVKEYQSKVIMRYNNILRSYIKIVSNYIKKNPDINYAKKNIETLFSVDPTAAIKKSCDYIWDYREIILESTVHNNKLLQIDYTKDIETNKKYNQKFDSNNDKEQFIRIIGAIKEMWVKLKDKEKEDVMQKFQDTLLCITNYKYILEYNEIPPKEHQI